MTTRPGNLGLDSLRRQRAKHLCHLLTLKPKQGDWVSLTDHDRALTFEGRVFRPVILGALSSDRRESGLRTGDQEATAFIDQLQISHLDLQGDKWTGAEVEQVVVDWRQPYIVLARHVRWIRKIQRQGQTFTATLEGRAQQLQQPNGGRFGGYFTAKCQYRFGSRACGANTHALTQHASLGVEIASSASWDSITRAGAGYVPNAYASTTTEYFYVITNPNGLITTGKGQTRKIESNSADTIYIEEPWETLPAANIAFLVCPGLPVSTVVRPRLEFKISGMLGGFGDQAYREGTVLWTKGPNKGLKSSIVDYRESDRKLTLLNPTPFDISVTDKAIVIVGCDGLASTCKNKFNNFVNFGGDPHAPSVQTIIEPPREIT